MTQLLVLGSGCAKCAKLYDLTAQAARELGLEHELQKVADLRQIMALRVMLTPAAGGERFGKTRRQSAQSGRIEEHPDPSRCGGAIRLLRERNKTMHHKTTGFIGGGRLPVVYLKIKP